MPTRKAEAEWKGNLAEGSGRLKVGSGAFDGPYSFKSRFEEGQSATNPNVVLARPQRQRSSVKWFFSQCREPAIEDTLHRCNHKLEGKTRISPNDPLKPDMVSGLAIGTTIPMIVDDWNINGARTSLLFGHSSHA